MGLNYDICTDAVFKMCSPDTYVKLLPVSHM